MDHPSSPRPILLVDDHPLARRGLKELLGPANGLQVRGEATRPDEALDRLAEARYDLVILDLSLRQGSGLELIKQVRCHHPRVRVLVCSMHDETLFAERCLRAGASGYIQKQEAAEEVLKAVRRVLSGHVYLSRAMTDHVLASVTGGARQEGGLESLSDRELEVFELIGHALGTREIADHLHLSPKTVESHRENIKRKLGLSNFNQLVQHAVVWVLSETGLPFGEEEPGEEKEAPTPPS